MSRISRRRFIQAGVGATAASLLEGRHLFSGSPGQTGQTDASGGAGPLCVIASGNGIRATEKAMELMRQGADPLDAVIAGVNIVEEDPNDMSVGYGGLPNEEGVVELDASVMYGPTHKAGCVAAIRNIKTPSKVAKLVMDRTAHVLLVGEGALKFAKAHGFKEEELLTEKAREVWLKWKESLSERDYWLSPDDKKIRGRAQAYVEHYGTINCLAVNARGILAGVTTTSGYAFKLPGRVGRFAHHRGGSLCRQRHRRGGFEGFGEANLRTCASFLIVQLMGQGVSPEEACLKAMQAVADKSKLQPRLLNEDGLPNFGHSFYALNKKGEFGSANMWSGGRFAVHDSKENTFREAAYLYKRKKDR